MKSLTAVCQTGASMPAMNPSGRVQRHPPHRGDGENAEMKMYLSKLKDLVPFMPKNRKLSKLEIIQHVIDYICDLQSELETHPGMGGAHGAAFDAASALNSSSVAVVSQLIQQQQQQHADDSDAGEMDDADEEPAGDEEDQLMAMQAAERLSAAAAVQHLQRQSSRQPLVDRQAPNTILPHTAAVANNTATTTSTAAATTSNSSSNTTAPQQMVSLPAVLL